MKKYYSILITSTVLLLSFHGFADTTTPNPLSSPVPTLTHPANPWCNQLSGAWKGTEKITGLHHCTYRASGFIYPQGSHAYTLILTVFRQEGSHNYCPYTHTQRLPLQCTNNLIAIRDKQIILDGHISVEPAQLYVTGSIANNKASILLSQTSKG